MSEEVSGTEGPRPSRGRGVLVLQPSSFELRLGWAEDGVPGCRIPHCIAWRRREEEGPGGGEDAQPRPSGFSDRAGASTRSALAATKTSQLEAFPIFGQLAQFRALGASESDSDTDALADPDQPTSDDGTPIPSGLPLRCDLTSTQTSSSFPSSSAFPTFPSAAAAAAHFVVGHEAAALKDSEEWTVHWPVRHGCIDDGPARGRPPLSLQLENLGRIWEHCIE